VESSGPSTCDESSASSEGETSDIPLKEALAEADVCSLLMVIVQLTGDRRWLEEPYRPERRDTMFSRPDAGLGEQELAEIRGAAYAAITAFRNGTPPAIGIPDHDLFLDMMSTYFGEELGREYVGLALEEMGLVSRDVQWRTDPSVHSEDFHVAIIGAGLSGICLAIHLARLGIRFSILEKNSSVGGTWFENQYPGCRVDVPNQFYSYSFKSNPNWTGYYSEQPEILNYLRDCVDESRIGDRIRLSTEVISAAYEPDSCCWQLELRTPTGKQRLEANVVVTAVGQLNRPNIPEIEGLSDFPGKVIHTAQWDPADDVTEKRIAVIGTGASAMQLVPNIAQAAAHVALFQRSPQWAIPNRDYLRKVSAPHRWLLTEVPLYRSWYRFGLLWRHGDATFPMLRIDPNWPGHARSISAHNERVRQSLTSYIERELEGREDLIAKALPDYPPFSKRLLIDNGWFQTIRRPNVELVVDPVVRIESNALITSNGQRFEVDMIVFATGFHASRMLWPLYIRGRDGDILSDVWEDDDPRAYLGITTPGFPNLFFMYGPSTNVAHGGSIFFQAECQTRYIVSCLREMIERRYTAIECKDDPFLSYNQKLDDAVCDFVWASTRVDNWYLNTKRRVVTNSPWRLVDYWSMTHDPNFEDFTVVVPDCDTLQRELDVT
jgi:4-hydroxyacetophenone monooxygenase